MVGRPMGAGGGSSDVVPHYTVPPLQGIKNVLQELGNTEAKIGLTLVDDDNSNIDQAIEAAKQADAVIIMAGSIAEEGADRATFADEIGLNAALSLGDTLDWYTDAPNKITSIARTDGKDLNPERNSQTIAMIEMILAATGDMFKKTAVVLKDNAGIAIPNSGALLGNSGPAILEVWFPGQEDGHIVADVLFGSVNPSGKTPVTFPIAGKGFLDTIAKDAIHFPGTSAKANGWVDTTDITVFPPLVFEDKALVEYKEGLKIGYRWYDSNASGKCALRKDLSNPCVAFPFGHGLSYTEFSVGDASLVYNTSKDTYTVNLPVTNEGNRQGKTVIQVYLGIPAPKQPPKRLVAFQKVSISSGETVQVSLDIDPLSANHPLGIYDTELKKFKIPAGPFIVYVGTSSSLRDLQILRFNR
jgi:beta-glucosidase